MIEIDDVSIAMRGRTVLDHCSVTLRAGTITHLAGANGSGKTTLIRALAGIQRYSGSIRFDGADVARVRSDLYVCFDDAPLLPYLNGYDNVRTLLGRSISRATILGVAPAIAGDKILRMRASSLSHGERKRVHLVAALASGAHYLVFDEALNGVDADTVSAVGIALSRLTADVTVLFTGHHEGTYGDLTARRIGIIDRHLVPTDDLAEGITA